LQNKFKFKLNEGLGYQDKIYNAKLVDDHYEVTWKPDEGKEQEYVRYQITTVQNYFLKGIWIEIK
jgi:hypothetical protein